MRPFRRLAHHRHAPGWRERGRDLRGGRTFGKQWRDCSSVDRGGSGGIVIRNSHPFEIDIMVGTKMKHLLISLPLISILFTGCGQGYKKENGRWAWVSWDEAVGRRVQFIDGADNGSFRVLSDKEYAADQKSVYHR